MEEVGDEGAVAVAVVAAAAAAAAASVFVASVLSPIVVLSARAIVLSMTIFEACLSNAVVHPTVAHTQSNDDLSQKFRSRRKFVKYISYALFSSHSFKLNSST